MHTVFALLCFVVVIHWLNFPYPSGLLHWHCGNLTIAPVPAKQPWWIWINTSCEFIMNDCKTTTKQSTTKPCAYFLGYTVGCRSPWTSRTKHRSINDMMVQCLVAGALEALFLLPVVSMRAALCLNRDLQITKMFMISLPLPVKCSATYNQHETFTLSCEVATEYVYVCECMCKCACIRVHMYKCMHM